MKKSEGSMDQRIQKRIYRIATNLEFYQYFQKFIKCFFSKIGVKVMATVFFDCRWLMPAASTITGNAYVETMRQLQERIRKKRPNSWVLHHDHAPTHRSFIVSHFLAQNRTTVLEHPPYSPDLAPCDYFSFDKIEDSMRGTHLGGLE